jgi:acyl-CoA thioesterase FadM
MGRIKLSPPEAFLYETMMPVRISDINYIGHLSNDAVLALSNEARFRFLASYGYDEKDIEGCSLIMTDAIIVFKSEAFYGEKLRIEVAVTDLTGIGFALYYRITETGTSREVAHLKTSMAFFSYANRRICPSPANFRAKF